MDNKQIGIALIFAALLMSIVLALLKIQLNEQADSLMELSSGSCFLENGKCIHERSFAPFSIGISVIVLILSIGVYLIYFAGAVKSLEASQKTILSKLESNDANAHEEKFKILLTGLDEDEKKAIMAVKEQDGISQSTLMLRVDMSKTKLSLVLKGLESKGLIKKVEKGKINLIYLKKVI